VAYDFTFYASRTATDQHVRSTRYTVLGANNGFADLDATNNGENVAPVHGIFPTPEGVIVIHLEAAPDNTEPIHFYYLTAMKIAWHEPLPWQVYVDADANDAAHPLPKNWNLLDMGDFNAVSFVDHDGIPTGIKAIVSATASSSDTWPDFIPTGDAAEFAPAWKNGAYTGGDTVATFTLYEHFTCCRRGRYPAEGRPHDPGLFP